jgi:hypothetical protein
VLRLRVAVAGEACELAALLAAGVAGDRQLRAVGEPNATVVEPAHQSLLHARDQLDERPQATVVLRLVRQPRKPARLIQAQRVGRAATHPVGFEPGPMLSCRLRSLW